MRANVSLSTLESYWRASHGGAILSHGICMQTMGMAGDSTTRKDTLKVEKASLLVLALCVVVLIYVLVARPF